VIARGTLVRIIDKTCPLYGALGDIKALYRDNLFLWIKNSLLVKTNGIFCVSSKMVVNAGAAHMREANESAGLNLNENQANPDR